MKKTDDINKVLHQPVRTRIMAYMIAHSSANFNDIKSFCDLTDGHMSTHMKELLAHNYISVKKTFVDNKPKTTYTITEVGKKEFTDYVNVLKKIVIGL